MDAFRSRRIPVRQRETTPLIGSNIKPFTPSRLGSRYGVATEERTEECDPVMSLVVAVVLSLGTTPLGAHEPFQVTGTIVRFQERSLVVKNGTGESFTFQLQQSTAVRREKERVPQTELKAGRNVVVRIMADSLYDEDPFVLSVSLVPAPRKAG